MSAAKDGPQDFLSKISMSSVRLDEFRNLRGHAAMHCTKSSSVSHSRQICEAMLESVCKEKPNNLKAFMVEFLKDTYPTASRQASPAAKFKASLAKMQAGEYDEAATKAELEGLISENKIVMFSFTT